MATLLSLTPQLPLTKIPIFAIIPVIIALWHQDHFARIKDAILNFRRARRLQIRHSEYLAPTPASRPHRKMATAYSCLEFSKLRSDVKFVP